MPTIIAQMGEIAALMAHITTPRARNRGLTLPNGLTPWPNYRPKCYPLPYLLAPLRGPNSHPIAQTTGPKATTPNKQKPAI